MERRIQATRVQTRKLSPEEVPAGPEEIQVEKKSLGSKQSVQPRTAGTPAVPLEELEQRHGEAPLASSVDREAAEAKAVATGELKPVIAGNSDEPTQLV